MFPQRQEKSWNWWTKFSWAKLFRFSPSGSVSAVGLTQASSGASQSTCSRTARGFIQVPSPISILVPFPAREEDGQTEVEELYNPFGCRLCSVSELPTTLSIILTQAALLFASNGPQAITRTRAIKMVFLAECTPQVASVTVDSARI